MPESGCTLLSPVISPCHYRPSMTNISVSNTSHSSASDFSCAYMSYSWSRSSYCRWRSPNGCNNTQISNLRSTSELWPHMWNSSPQRPPLCSWVLCHISKNRNRIYQTHRYLAFNAWYPLSCMSENRVTTHTTIRSSIDTIMRYDKPCPAMCVSAYVPIHETQSRTVRHVPWP